MESTIIKKRVRSNNVSVKLLILGREIYGLSLFSLNKVVLITMVP